MTCRPGDLAASGRSSPCAVADAGIDIVIAQCCNACTGKSAQGRATFDREYLGGQLVKHGSGIT